MTLTGQSVHRAFVSSFPYLAPNWDALPPWSKQGYEYVARELNQVLEQDTVTIVAARCSKCGEMLEAEHAEGHACWLEQESYTVRSDWSALQKELGS